MTPEKRKRLSELERNQAIYTRDMEVEIFERTNSGPNINKIRYTTLRMGRSTRISLDRKATRMVLHNRALGRNWGLFKDLFIALRPINCEKWRKGNIIKRAFMLTKIPAVIICCIYIPLVDYELDKHGWNKLLNCIQVMLNPAMSIMAIKGAFDKVIVCSRALKGNNSSLPPIALLSSRGNSLWYVAMGEEAIYAMYSLPITVPIAVFMFIQSRTDVPPFYHSVSYSGANRLHHVNVSFEFTGVYRNEPNWLYVYDLHLRDGNRQGPGSYWPHPEGGGRLYGRNGEGLYGKSGSTNCQRSDGLARISQDGLRLSHWRTLLQ